MGDNYGGTTSAHHLYGINDIGLGTIIQRACGFIEEKKFCFPVEGSCQGKSLTLTAREFHAILSNRV